MILMKKMLRKIGSLVTVFLLILIMMPVGANKVKAAEGEYKPKIVAYGGIVQNQSGGYSGLYAVKQSLFKKADAYTSSSTGPYKISTAETLGPGNMSSASSLSFAKSDPDFNVFNGSSLRAELAYFTLDELGNVSITLQNEVVIERLNIYYIIAGKTDHVTSPTSMVMCGATLCKNAKKITSPDTTISGSWQDGGKTGRMSYTEGTITAAGFEKKVNNTGVTTYSGFNVVNRMSEGNRRYAVSLGAFVVITMAVRNLAEYEGMNNENVYYVNTALPSNMTFTGIAYSATDPSTDVYGNVYANAHFNVSESLYNSRNANMGGYVERYAALVHTLPDSIGNEGVEDLLEQFDIYLKPIIEIGLGILLIVKGTMLIITIVKSSDEPEVRRESIKHLVSLFITVALIMLIIWFMKDIIDVLSDFIMET